MAAEHHAAPEHGPVTDASAGRTHHVIAVVGAGPRGTSVLERLCAAVPELAPQARVSVHMIDPAPPGAGRVWRTTQSGELLMNTVASQVTLFTDASVSCDGPVRPGPSLHEWAVARGLPLGPDDYPTRALYGRYLEWVFAHTVASAPGGVTVETHAARAVRLAEEPDGTQVVDLDDGRRLTGLTAVVLAQGHLPALPTPAQRRFADHAVRHGLRYLPPANPADVTDELDRVAPGEPVLLRGLGLTFFDHMALLTRARGGRFTTDPDTGRLVYRPSGHEPRLYAGSRRGVPYRARGDNAKGPYGRHEPLLLTPDVIEGFRKRTAAGDPPDFLADVWPLVAKEVEAVHYAAVLARADPALVDRFRDRFLRTVHGSREEAAVLDEFGFPDDGRRWDWGRLTAPDAGRDFTGRADFRGWLLELLREDVAGARLGNVAGPVPAALDVLRDLRNELRQIVDHGGLDGGSRRDHLDGWYTPLNAFLSIGPPRHRVEQLVALIEAGTIEVLGPGLEVTAGHDDAGRPAFVAHSPRVPGARVAVRTLVDARLPEPRLPYAADPLLAGLLRSGACRTHVVGGHDTGGLDVGPRPYHLIDRQGMPHARRFAIGVPTEGVHWVTAAGVRPGVDSVTLGDTDAVARAVLRVGIQPPSCLNLAEFS